MGDEPYLIWIPLTDEELGHLNAMKSLTLMIPPPPEIQQGRQILLLIQPPDFFPSEDS